MGVDISTTLPALLAKKGWTQEKLAGEAKLRRTDVNALARGRLKAGPKRLGRIAAALEVSVLELGAPIALRDQAGATLLDRLEELSELVALGFETLGLDVADLRRAVDDRARMDAQDESPE